MSSTTTTTTTPAATPAGPPLPPPPPALPVLPAQPTRTMAALALLPPRRRVVLRAGRTTNPARPSNLEAELGQIVSQTRVFRCIHYTRGQGVWTVCVVVPDYFRENCTNYHYSSEGTRCSFRPAAAAPAAPATPASPTSPVSPTTRRRLRLRHRTISSSYPLYGIATRYRIVDQVTPGNTTNRLYRPRYRYTPAERARRLAELYRELAALYKEEAEVLEERI
ncbi:hypothetical protein NA56DRAFT_648259 [Hyaloscypha hepaticicola]|uniref:Uncharacterized protein n=1 Tax=Hyaloscypha hepaticicola TaxID=2082293 RepID=A0A2J6PVR6_9HELO|nr:hypothetical protein NA56DRAFT_648259 [Hyaloscypha hepaticicola]